MILHPAGTRRGIAQSECSWQLLPYAHTVNAAYSKLLLIFYDSSGSVRRIFAIGLPIFLNHEESSHMECDLALLAY